MPVAACARKGRWGQAGLEGGARCWLAGVRRGPSRRCMHTLTSTLVHTRCACVVLYRCSSSAETSAKSSNSCGSPTASGSMLNGDAVNTMSPRRTAPSKSATAAAVGHFSRPGLLAQPSFWWCTRGVCSGRRCHRQRVGQEHHACYQCVCAQSKQTHHTTPHLLPCSTVRRNRRGTNSGAP